MKNKEEIKKYMNIVEKFISKRLPKRDIKIQGNHEYKENNCVGIQSLMGSILSQMKSKNIE